MTDRTHVLATGGDDPQHETARAMVVGGDRLFASRSIGLMVAPHPHAMRYWPSQPIVINRDPDMAPGMYGVGDDVPEGYTSTLEITEKEALALYNALADHFGHSVHDMRALRRDHDAQGKRLDKVTDALITIATREPTPQVFNVSTPPPAAT